MMNRDRKQRAGYAFLTIVLITALFLGLAGAMGSQILTSLSATKKRLGSSTSRFAAYSGLQNALQELKKDAGWNEDIIGALMPGSNDLSYTVQVTNNTDEARSDPSFDSGELDAQGNMTAPDGTKVPPRAVYCAAMGIHNGQDGVRLHAMAGMVGQSQPQLTHGAFSENLLAMSGNSQSKSYDPDNITFSPDSNGRVSVSDATQFHDLGDVGTNRNVSLTDSAMVSGVVFRPSGSSITSSAIAELDAHATGDSRTLTDPVKVPEYSDPTVIPVNSQSMNVAPGPAAMTVAPQSATSSEPSALDAPTVYRTLYVAEGGTCDVAPGTYFFPDGIDLQGTLRATSAVDNDHPIIFYVGNSAEIGPSALVNPGGITRNFQVYFVDRDTLSSPNSLQQAGGTPQTFKMTGDSQFFGTVVGHTVKGDLSSNAQLFGAFLGRSMSTSGNAQIVFDESLAEEPLEVSAGIGLSGVTEPKPSAILQSYAATRTFVAAVQAGTPSYVAQQYQASSNPSF